MKKQEEICKALFWLGLLILRDVVILLVQGFVFLLCDSN